MQLAKNSIHIINEDTAKRQKLQKGMLYSGATLGAGAMATTISYQPGSAATLPLLGTNVIANSTIFYAGAGLTAFGGAFAIAHAVYHYYYQKQIVNNISAYFCHEVEKLTTEEIIHFKKKDNVNIFSSEDIFNCVKAKMIQKFNQENLIGNLVSILGLGGAFFTLGVMFPPAFIPLMAVAGAVFVLGGVAALINYRMQLKKINKVFKDIEKKLSPAASEDTQPAVEDNIKSLLDIKANSLSAVASESSSQTKGIIVYKERKNIFKNITLGCFVISIPIQFVYAASFVAPMLVIGAGIATHVALGFLSLAQLTLVAIKTENKLRNLTTTLTKELRTNIDAKRFGLFGKTPFEDYIASNLGDVKETLGKVRDMTFTTAMSELEKNKITRERFRMRAEQQFLRDKLGLKKDEAITDDKLLESLKANTQRQMVNKVRQSGLINSLFLALAVAGLASVAPPLAPVFIGVAVGLFVLIASASFIFAEVQRRRLGAKIDKAMKALKSDDFTQFGVLSDELAAVKQFLVTPVDMDITLPAQNADGSTQQPASEDPSGMLTIYSGNSSNSPNKDKGLTESDISTKGNTSTCKR